MNEILVTWVDDEGRYESGLLVRKVTKGRRKGWLVVRIYQVFSHKDVLVSPDRVRKTEEYRGRYSTLNEGGRDASGNRT